MNHFVKGSIAIVVVLIPIRAHSTTPKENCSIVFTNECISDADVKTARTSYPLEKQIEGYVYFDFDQIMPGHMIEESPSLIIAKYNSESQCASKYEFSFEKTVQSISYERTLKQVRYFFLGHTKTGVKPLSITTELPSKLVPGNPQGQSHPESAKVRCDLFAN